jgi:hypothetical protein
MCPVLRGELPPIPSTELAGLRDSLERSFGHNSVSTPSGPLLVVRVPVPQPDLIRDLEAAADHLPPLDLQGYRGAVLIGDQAQLGVSIDMLRSLLSTRMEAEIRWLEQRRSELAPWDFTVARLPSDAHRRLRVILHVDRKQVSGMMEKDFDHLAGLLPQIRSRCPGGCTPAFVYLVAQEDHVRIEGERFFGELEARLERVRRRNDQAERRKREETYQIARGHIARIEERRAQQQRTRGPPADLLPTRTRADRYRTHTASPLEQTPVGRKKSVEDLGPSQGSRTKPPLMPGSPAQRRRDDAGGGRSVSLSNDPLFRGAMRYTQQVDHLRGLLKDAGYETKERLVVDAVPLALAAARPEGYPRRVLATFYDRLGVDDARRILRVARGASAELALIITPETEDGVDRVTLATNLKVIAPEAVAGLRLD